MVVHTWGKMTGVFRYGMLLNETQRSYAKEKSSFTAPYL